jgi:hypothetical protein
VTRDELIHLLSTGLTPDEVGRLYDRSGSLVRKAARRWNVDCRALRARALGLAATAPAIAAQFVEVVDGAPSWSRPEDLLAGSGARCRWRCDDCGCRWVTSVANRTKRHSGCPACARREGKRLARARPAKTPPLSIAHPHLASEFVSNLSRPDRDAESTPSGSHDRVMWRCTRGHCWETVARQRVKYATQCPVCLTGLWTSRLEFEVGELVSASTGLTVRVGARLPRRDRSSDDHVDLLVEELDLLVDLDPSRWHNTPEAIRRDARKLDRLAGRRYVRIRSALVGRLKSETTTVEQQVVLSGPEDRADSWASAVVQAVMALSPDTPVEELPEVVHAAALARADRKWRRLRAEPLRRSLATEHPAVAAQFVGAVGRPGLTPAELAPAGDDRVLWECPDCGHRWEARTANRTLLGTGCPPCSYQRGARRSATARPGRSFADAHPALAALFIRNETHPGKSAAELKPNSVDRCVWSCPYCAQPWVATPHSLHRRPTSGCRSCGHARSADKRRTRRGAGPDQGEFRHLG